MMVACTPVIPVIAGLRHLVGREFEDIPEYIVPANKTKGKAEENKTITLVI